MNNTILTVKNSIKTMPFLNKKLIYATMIHLKKKYVICFKTDKNNCVKFKGSKPIFRKIFFEENELKLIDVDDYLKYKDSKYKEFKIS
jgi:hypothetical protein